MCVVLYKFKFIFVESEAKFFSIVLTMVKNINEAIGKKNQTWYD